MHMAQLMPLPFTVSCFSKIQISFTFLVPAHLGSPGQRAVKWVCVCVCCSSFTVLIFATWAAYFRWVSSLQLTRVTRWGGMISTPDSVLQTVIKRALIDSGCPGNIVTELMENSHERRWPPGLSTLEARQLNRRFYENYVCKRIPGTYSCTLPSFFPCLALCIEHSDLTSSLHAP